MASLYDRILAAINPQAVQEIRMTLDELKATIEDLKTDVQANTDAAGSVLAALNGVRALVVDLKQQIADLIAGGVGATPAQLQELGESVAAVDATLEQNNQALADAAIENT